MPIYEYRCNECEHEVEALQKLSDAPLVTCPACGKPALQKRVSAAGFQLKGSGWYVTDFRGGGGAKKKPDKPDAPATDAAKSETKTESTAKSESSTPASTTTGTSSTTSSGSSES